MNRSALFIISGDPIADHRPAEAVRIAAGVHAWQKIHVRLYLHHPATRALADRFGEVRDEDQLRHALPVLAESGQPVYVPTGQAPLLAREFESVHWQEITEPELAALAAASTWVLYF